MGLMACDRRGCDRTCCTRMIDAEDLIGFQAYVCDECYAELEESALTNLPPYSTPREAAVYAKDFLSKPRPVTPDPDPSDHPGYDMTRDSFTELVCLTANHPDYQTWAKLEARTWSNP